MMPLRQRFSTGALVTNRHLAVLMGEAVGKPGLLTTLTYQGRCVPTSPEVTKVTATWEASWHGVIRAGQGGLLRPSDGRLGGQVEERQRQRQRKRHGRRLQAAEVQAVRRPPSRMAQVGTGTGTLCM